MLINYGEFKGHDLYLNKKYALSNESNVIPKYIS